MWSIYTGKNVCEQFPTKELWGKLSKILQFEIPYEKWAQTYNAQMGITDVWNDIDFYSEERYHPTQKPVKLIQRLILASSNKGDTVLDPFMGAGSTLIASNLLGRECIGFELDDAFCKVANLRANGQSFMAETLSKKKKKKNATGSTSDNALFEGLI